MLNSIVFSGMSRIKVRTQGGDPVKIKVRKDLILPPANRNAVGLLHINGTKIYIPENATIAVGTDIESDIRVFGKGIRPSTLLIMVYGDGEQEKAVFELCGDISVMDEITGETKKLTLDTRVSYMANNNVLLAIPAGRSDHLLMKLEIVNPETERQKDAFLNAICAPRLMIENVPPSEALQKVEDEPITPIIDSARLDSHCIQYDSPFRLAETYDELFKYYLSEIFRLERNEKSAIKTAIMSTPLIGALLITSIMTGVATYGILLGLALGFAVGFLCVKPTRKISALTGELKTILYLCYIGHKECLIEELGKLSSWQRAKIFKGISGIDPIFASALEYAVKMQLGR